VAKTVFSVPPAWPSIFKIPDSFIASNRRCAK
jgi:hypothetical protein